MFISGPFVEPDLGLSVPDVRPFDELPPDPDPYPDVDRLRAADPVDDEDFARWLDALAATSDGVPPPGPAAGDITGRAPSGWFAFELDTATVDPTTASDEYLIDAVVAWERIASWATARQARVLAEFNRRRPADTPEAAMCDRPALGSRWAPDEVGLALTLSRGSAIIRLDHGARLAAELSPTLELLEQGRLDAGRARAICLATTGLSTEVATAVQAKVLPKAPRQTLAQLRAALARAVLAADPRGPKERHQAARDQRRVRLEDEGDGMASLWALLAAPDAISAYTWLTRLARSMGKDDPRGMDARRADLVADLLTGRLELHDYPDPAPDPAAPDPAAPDPAAPDPAASDPAAPESVGPRSGDLRTAPAAHRTDPGVGRADAEDAPDAPDAEHGESGARHAAGAHGEPTAASCPDDADDSGPSDSGPGRPRRAEPAVPRPPAAGKPLVHVIVPYTTLTGVDDQPCELSGYGPIPADLAREIAADGVWKRLVTDPVSGAVLDHGRTTYRPPAALADFVRARDGRCRSPICRERALNCEIDHMIAWADGGHTSEQNLMDGCPHHHHLKHQAGWRVFMNDDRTITWETPTGHRYVSDPYDYRPQDPVPPLIRRTAHLKPPVPEQLTPAAEPAGPSELFTGVDAGAEWEDRRRRQRRDERQRRQEGRNRPSAPRISLEAMFGGGSTPAAADGSDHDDDGQARADNGAGWPGDGACEADPDRPDF